jgi:hypothetical protein
MSAISIAATHPAHLPAGAPCDVRVSVRVSASGLGERGAGVTLRLWMPLGASLAALRERAPARRDLRERATRRDERTVEVDAGAWTDGDREYELAIALPAGRAGDELLAARLVAVIGGAVAAAAPIAITWTDDARPAGTAGRPAGAARTSGVGPSELPTGPSPAPRHTGPSGSPVATSCPACDLRAGDGDRFCERCGHELAGG